MNCFIQKLSLLTICLVTISSFTFGHDDQNNVTQKPKSLDFIQNNGQWDNPSKFKAEVPGGVLFLTQDGFVYNFRSQEDEFRLHNLYEAGEYIDDELINFHAYKVSFVNASPNAAFKGEKERSYYHNYFLGDNQSRWKGRVPLFGDIQIVDVYSGINAKVYSSDLSMKYDFIVKPNINPNKIQLKFEGVSPVLLASGDLKITTSVNEVIESKPYSYQIIGGQKVTVPSKYVLEDNILSFAFPDGYNENYELVIDPTLIFATYSGATGSAAYSYTTTYDNGGSLYAGADSWGLGWPVTLGAFQTNFAAGSHDVGVNKYTPNGGALVYSTYYGGSGADYPNSMIVNNQNELIIIGNTMSTNLPVTVGCYDNTFNGGRDVFIAHFNNDGTGLIGATYLGTNATEPGTFNMNGSSTGMTGQNTTSPLEINFDTNGNIWGVSNTTSPAFPVTANALQATSGGGMDGVVFQFDPTLSNLLYSTYLGGSSNEALYGIQFNSLGHVVVCGVTQSSNFPTTPNTLMPTAAGGLDGFVSIINPVTGALVASTYVGTTASDHTVNLQVDEFDNVFVLGRTMGNYPISPNVYNTPNGDIFVDKISSDLTTSLLSTRLGTPQTTTVRYFPTAFLLDNCQNIYIAGLGSTLTGSQNTLPSGMPLTPDAFSVTANNFYFVALKPDFNDILFGSYYGSGNDHTHVGVNRLDPAGNVYHSVCSASSAWPTTPGVYGQSKLNSGQDIVSFKFDFEANGVKSHPGLDSNQADTGCVPFTVTFTNTSTSPYAMDFNWNFGDGGTSTATSPTYTFNTPGIYKVALHAHSDSACITDDIDTLTIVVYEVFKPIISVQDTIICGQVDVLDVNVNIANPTSNTTILWTPNTGIIGPDNVVDIQVNPAVTSQYIVTVKDTIPGICGFSTTDTFNIDYAPRAVNILTNDTIICQDATIQIHAEGTPNFDYVWSPAEGLSDINILEPTATVTGSRTYTLTASHEGCTDTSQTLTIDIQRTPTIDLGPDQEVCQWELIELTPSITPYRNDYTYTWTPNTSLYNMSDGNAQFNSDTTITFKLTVSTPIGCTGSDSVTYKVIPGNFGDIIADTGYCPPKSIELWASGGVSYHWSPEYGLDNATIATPIANPETPTQYSVIIKNNHGCLDTQYVNIEAYSLGIVQIPDEVTIYEGEEYQVDPITNALYFNWFPPSGVSNTSISNPILKPDVRTRYFVTASTENGCQVKDSIDVLVEDIAIDMPNAFTPGNGINGTLKPSKRGILKLNEFAIFNRWGVKVYSSNNIDEGWDGTFKGSQQPMGVYIYVIDAVSNSGKNFKKEGNITLIR